MSTDYWYRQCLELGAALSTIRAALGLRPDATSEQILTKLRDRIDEGNAMAHIIVEAGIVPGEYPTCRCDECRRVARGMAEAGYLDRVKDRWWEDKPEAAHA